MKIFFLIRYFIFIAQQNVGTYIEQFIFTRYLTLFTISICFFFLQLSSNMCMVSYSYWNRTNRFVCYIYYGWYTSNRNQHLSEKVTQCRNSILVSTLQFIMKRQFVRVYCILYRSLKKYLYFLCCHAVFLVTFVPFNSVL